MNKCKPLYSGFYFFTKLDISKTVPSIMYFAYMVGPAGHWGPATSSNALWAWHVLPATSSNALWGWHILPTTSSNARCTIEPSFLEINGIRQRAIAPSARQWYSEP